MTKQLFCGLAVATVAMAALVLTTSSANAATLVDWDFSTIDHTGF